MKISKFLTFSIVLSILVISIATASLLIPANDNAKENSQAAGNSPVIEETDSGGWELERVDFIHYVKPNSPAKASRTDSCYKLMGVKWRTTPLNYIINPSNPDSLSEGFVASAISESAETWDSATSRELFNNTYKINYTANYGNQDFNNVIDFGNLNDDRAIAVTTIWYTIVGKQIVEYDIRFNTQFKWGDATINSSLMDLRNIAVHEKGHGFGLADIYSTACSEVTLYGYSNYGETKKRTLEQPDITGLQKLYGI
ncbi:MAG: matrixin family metalloprotease [Nanoarchaeota archaeon]